MNTWWRLPLLCADHHALNGVRSSWKSCGANDHLRRVAGAQPSSTLFDKEAATYVVTTSERRQRALHDMPFGVMTATPVSANSEPEAGGFLRLEEGRRA